MFIKFKLKDFLSDTLFRYNQCNIGNSNLSWVLICGDQSCSFFYFFLLQLKEKKTGNVSYV